MITSFHPSSFKSLNMVWRAFSLETATNNHIYPENHHKSVLVSDWDVRGVLTWGLQDKWTCLSIDLPRGKERESETRSERNVKRTRQAKFQKVILSAFLSMEAKSFRAGHTEQMHLSLMLWETRDRCTPAGSVLGFGGEGSFCCCTGCSGTVMCRGLQYCCDVNATCWSAHFHSAVHVVTHYEWTHDDVAYAHFHSHHMSMTLFWLWCDRWEFLNGLVVNVFMHEKILMWLLCSNQVMQDQKSSRIIYHTVKIIFLSYK